MPSSGCTYSTRTYDFFFHSSCRGYDVPLHTFVRMFFCLWRQFVCLVCCSFALNSREGGRVGWRGGGGGDDERREERREGGREGVGQRVCRQIILGVLRVVSWQHGLFFHVPFALFFMPESILLVLLFIGRRVTARTLRIPYVVGLDTALSCELRAKETATINANTTNNADPGDRAAMNVVSHHFRDSYTETTCSILIIDHRPSQVFYFRPAMFLRVSTFADEGLAVRGVGLPRVSVAKMSKHASVCLGPPDELRRSCGRSNKELPCAPASCRGV